MESSGREFKLQFNNHNHSRIEKTVIKQNRQSTSLAVK